MAAKKVKDDQKDTPTTVPTVDYEPARPGGFVRVVAGPHAGRYGVLHGGRLADVALVRTRDDRDEYIQVSLADVRNDAAGRR